ncbi:MAG: hypothetical protein JW953_13410 [Anaerolineae bacterium]|nr:hypothetical protein [Anaerolineae bacterium]
MAGHIAGPVFGPDHGRVKTLDPAGEGVLQLNEVDVRQQQVMVAALLRRIYQARMQTSKEQIPPDDTAALPNPVFILI